MKGKTETVSVFEVFPNELKDELKIETKNDFEEGLALYFDREFAESSVCFNRVLKRNPGDTAASLYLQRSADFMVHGVPPDWEES